MADTASPAAAAVAREQDDAFRKAREQKVVEFREWKLSNGDKP